MISTHILDISTGSPAQGVAVTLEKSSGGNWVSLGLERTDNDGRIAFKSAIEPGTYRLQFQTEEYFSRNKVSAFFSEVPVIFHVTDGQRKYHVPLLLSPYGYSTYRGS